MKPITEEPRAKPIICMHDGQWLVCYGNPDRTTTNPLAYTLASQYCERRNKAEGRA